MEESSSTKNKRIAKNTVLLYFRTLILMVISLFTSRLTLEALGIDNFGIYNVVGGFIGMFSLISGTITSSISRYLTHGLGKGDQDNLTKLFSTSVNVLAALGLIIILIGESFGIWFLYNKLNIPADSLWAAFWVLQCTLFSFIVNLISVPYNASIVSHEKMGAFSYMTILEVILKLLFVYFLFVTPFDRLITYAVSLCIVGLVMRLAYGIYCTHHFEECKYRLIFDYNQFKDIAGFAGWNFLGNISFIFSTQGINIIMNMFFGVAINAARGVAAQVEGAVMALVNNFTMAFNPQITKSWAEGNTKYMYSLICRGTKFSIFLYLFVLIPLFIEAPIVLNLWLKDVPEFAPTFLRGALLCSASMLISNSGYTSVMANGNIRNYQIATSCIGILTFPLSYLCYLFGAHPVASYAIFFWMRIINFCILLYFLQRLVGLNIQLYIKSAILPILYVTLSAIMLPFLISHLMEDSIGRLILITIVSIISTAVSIYYLGLSRGERNTLSSQLRVKMKLCDK